MLHRRLDPISDPGESRHGYYLSGGTLTMGKERKKKPPVFWFCAKAYFWPRYWKENPGKWEFTWVLPMDRNFKLLTTYLGKMGGRRRFGRKLREVQLAKWSRKTERGVPSVFLQNMANIWKAAKAYLCLLWRFFSFIPLNRGFQIAWYRHNDARLCTCTILYCTVLYILYSTLKENAMIHKTDWWKGWYLS